MGLELRDVDVCYLLQINDARLRLLVTEAEILKYFSLKNMDEITAEHVVKLISLANSIKDGYTTLDVEFRPEKVKEEAISEGVAAKKEDMREKGKKEEKDSDRLL